MFNCDYLLFLIYVLTAVTAYTDSNYTIVASFGSTIQLSEGSSLLGQVYFYCANFILLGLGFYLITAFDTPICYVSSKSRHCRFSTLFPQVASGATAYYRISMISSTTNLSISISNLAGQVCILS